MSEVHHSEASFLHILYELQHQRPAIIFLNPFAKKCPQNLIQVAVDFLTRRSLLFQVYNNNNNNNIYRGSPTRQGGFQWGPHALI